MPSAVHTKAMGQFDIALTKEPSVHKGNIREFIYKRTSEISRTGIVIFKGINILLLNNFCSMDLTVIKLKTTSGGSPYLPYERSEPPPTRVMEELVRACRVAGSQLIIHCQTNNQYANERGENLL